jgi:hypothetical protein
VDGLRDIASPEMVESKAHDTDAGYLRALPKLIEQVSEVLSPEDTILAQTLVTLLSHFDRLSTISQTQGPAESVANATSSKPTTTIIQPPASGDVFDTLKKQVNTLQEERMNNMELSRPGSPPVFAVESALLWSRIDQDLDDVLSMCRQRTDTASFAGLPAYDSAPPEYDTNGTLRRSFDSKSVMSSAASVYNTSDMNEKMRMDLEAVTSAIDRLYVVLPQLHSQRVELKDPKRREMEKARAAENHKSTNGVNGKHGKGKAAARMEEEEDERDKALEFDKMMGLIGKASERKMVDQAVVIDGNDMQARMRRARQRELDKVCLQPFYLMS